MPEEHYYVGLDVGRKKDFSAIAVILRKIGHFFLVHQKRFPLQTEYVQVLAYLSLVGEHFRTVRAYYIDETGVGDVFVENARKQGLKNVKGIVLTLPQKQEVMTCLRQVMEEKRLHMPRDRELMSEMSGEIAELTMAGKTKFYHRSGTHDDRLWALALAVYGARYETEVPRPYVVTGRSAYGWLMPRLPRQLFRAARPVVPALAWDNEPAGVPKRVCPVCALRYVYESGEDSPCGHVTKEGTLVLPEPHTTPSTLFALTERISFLTA